MGIRDMLFGKPDYRKLEDQANKHGEEGNLKQAEKVWRKLNAHYPEKAEPYKMIGAMIFQTDDYAGALDWFRKAAAIEPNAITSLNMGVSLKALGDVTEARQHFEDAVRLAPDNIQARHNLAVITEDIGDLEASLEAWQWMSGLQVGSQIDAGFFSDIRRKIEDLEVRISNQTDDATTGATEASQPSDGVDEGEPIWLFPDNDRCGVIFLFDYERLGVSYGKRVFTTIWSALKSKRGRCLFADGDVMLTAGNSPGASPYIRGMDTHSEVVPTYTKGLLNLLGTADVAQCHVYAVAVYQEDYYTKPVHNALQDEFHGAYLGCLLLQQTIYSRTDFEDRVGFWQLVMSMETQNGQILQNGHGI